MQYLPCAVWVGVIVLTALLISPPASHARAPNGERLSVYISTGDSLWLGDWLPIDNEQAIEEVLDHNRRVLGANELIWRGGEDWMLHNHVIRRANADCYELWKYVDQVMRDGQLNRAVVRRAHQHGLKVSFLTELLGYGGVGDIHPVVQPYEHKLRQQHPEWTAVNRYGTRRSNGPMEFAYPEVRRFLIDDLVAWSRSIGYDAVLFHTYVENFGLRYPDEFGFSQPIVDEYKKRHGVDIRTERYDSEKLGQIRGEFVTQFLRELKAELNKHGMKLKLCIDSQQPDVAMSWMAAGRIRMGGNIQMDWRTWIKEEIVDELVSFGGSYEAAEKVLQQAKGSRTAVSMLGNWSIELPELIQQGMGNVRLVTEQHTLFGATNYRPPLGLSWPLADTQSGFLEPPPTTATLSISSREAMKLDRTAKLALLRNVQFKAASAPFEVIDTLCQDPSILVRRQAMMALVGGDYAPGQAAHRIIPMLEDTQAGVRCLAVTSLASLGKTPSASEWTAPAASAMIRSLELYPGFAQQFATRQALSTLPSAQTAPLDGIIRQGAASSVPAVRATCYAAMGGRDASSENSACIVKGFDDPDFQVRQRAIAAFGLVGRADDFPAFLEALRDDADQDVQGLAALALLDYVRRNTPLDPRHAAQAIDLLQARFVEYGQECARTDAGWGFRPCGQALLTINPDEQRKHLEGLVRQTSDPVLAARAWIVLYDVPTGSITAEEDDRLHASMPPQVLQGLRSLVAAGLR